MKKNKNFISWYYSGGIEEFLEVWKNFLRFCLYYFSLRELFLTLFYPWRKDIAFRDWRGWNPAKLAGIIFNNAFARLMGFIVRSLVIAAGLFFLAATFALGALLLVWWLAWPLLLLAVFLKSSDGNDPRLIEISFLVIFILLAYLFYRRSMSGLFYEMDLRELEKRGLLKRIRNRLGWSEKEADLDTLENPEKREALLKDAGLSQEDFEKILSWEIGCRQKKENAKKFWLWENLAKKIPIGKNWKYAYTVKLDNCSSDLSQGDISEYRDNELVGRTDELKIMQLVLERPVQNSVLLAGNPGVGKKTLVHHLARLIRQNKVGGGLTRKRFLIFELGSVMSAAVRNGQDPESVLRQLFNEAAYAGNVILIIENIEHYLGGADDVEHPNIASVLAEYLLLPTFQIIALATSNGYHDLISKQGEITKYLEVIEIMETTEDETLDIMLRAYEQAETRKVIFTYPALKNIIKFSKHYKWDTPFPERALDLMNEVLLYWEKECQDEFITAEVVDRFLTIKTGIPTGKIDKGEQEKLLHLENILHQRVVGQDEAVKEVSEALRKARSGVGNDEKPIGSFLFLGPTGVGKTETAKALAKAYFGSEEKMIRMDMSEFQAPNAIERIIGSEQAQRKGWLVKMAKDNPYSLLLLDEIEKAHPDVLDLFLQVLDEGFITDAFGEKINFRNMIIIATSNAGGSLIKEMVEKKEESLAIKKAVIDAAIKENIFKTEFMNRFNGIVFFSPLKEKELKSVVSLMLGRFARRLQAEKNIELEFDADTVEKIIAAGYEPVFGARSLDRYIGKTIEDAVVKKIIAEEVHRGEKVKIIL